MVKLYRDSIANKKDITHSLYSEGNTLTKQVYSFTDSGMPYSHLFTFFALQNITAYLFRRIPIIKSNISLLIIHFVSITVTKQILLLHHKCYCYSLHSLLISLLYILYMFIFVLFVKFSSFTSLQCFYTSWMSHLSISTMQSYSEVSGLS